MEENELLSLLRLQRLPHVGAINAKKLVDRCGSAAAVFKEKKPALRKIDGIGEVVLRSLWDTKYIEAAEGELSYIKRNEIECTSFLDIDYPRNLKHCIDGPILLFKRGDIDLENKRLISIVGTRNMTSYGQSFCEELISAISPLNPIIVSGFAYGVDIFAQRKAVEAGLQTIACLAHGLNQIYPKTHQKYMGQIEKNGGFVTEFWSSSNPDRENFLKRNRIIAGISEATIVIESAQKGGSLVTANIAHSYNRDVFAVPGRTSDKYSLGCNNLIKQQKAHMLTSAADLVYILGWEIEAPSKVQVQKELFVELTDSEKVIYTFLQTNGKEQLDIIALECQMPIFKVSSTLLNMEMKGAIRPLPGKLFEAI